MFGKEKVMKMEDEGFTDSLLRAKRLMNKFLEVEARLKIVEGECANMRSLYEAKVAVSGTSKSVISEVGECGHLIGQGTNEVISNVNNNNTAIDVIVLSDDESNDGRNQEEQCRIRANSSTQNRASGKTITPMALQTKRS